MTKLIIILMSVFTCLCLNVKGQIQAEQIVFIESGSHAARYMATKDKATTPQFPAIVHEKNNSNAADFRWKIEAADQTWVYFIHQKSGKLLTVKNGGTSAKTVLTLLPRNNSNAQKFKIEKVPNSGTHHHIIPKVNPNLRLDLNDRRAMPNTPAIIYTPTSSTARPSAKWKIVSNAPIYNNNFSGKTVEIQSGSNAYRYLTMKDEQLPAVVHEKRPNNENLFKWKLESAGNGWFYLKHLASGRTLEVKNGGTSPKTTLWLQARNGNNAQKFKIEKVPNSGTHHHIVPKVNSNLRVDLNDRRAMPNTPVIIYTSASSTTRPSAKWKIIKVE